MKKIIFSFFLLAAVNLYSQCCCGYLILNLAEVNGNYISLKDKDIKMKIIETVNKNQKSVIINDTNLLYYFSDRGFDIKNSVFNTDCGYDEVIFEMDYKEKIMVLKVTGIMMDYQYKIDKLLFNEGQYALELEKYNNDKRVDGVILIHGEDIK